VLTGNISVILHGVAGPAPVTMGWGLQLTTPFPLMETPNFLLRPMV